jgi:hypothetical protein
MSVKRLSFVVLLAVIALLPVWLVPSAGDPVSPEKAVAAPAAPYFPQQLLGPELLISQAPGMPETERFAPAVAANWVRGENLVVWYNQWPNRHRDIYARRVSNEGRLLSWFAITSGPEDRLHPDVAFNASEAEYLVVWMQDVSGNGSQYEIWGKIVAWDGSYRKPEFRIASGPGRTFRVPRVVWNNNRNQYLVVWSAADTTTGLPKEVASVLIDRHGNKGSVTILTTSTMPQQPDVAYGWSTDQYLVVFVSYNAATTSNDIYGLLVSSDNAVVSPPGVISIYSGAKHQNRPRVASDGQGDYVVIWEHEYLPGDNDIYARMVDKNGTVDGGYGHRTSSQDQTSPAIAASSNATHEYVAVWQRATPTGQVLDGLHWAGGLLQLFPVTGGEFGQAASPAVVFNRPHYFFAWEGDSPGDPTVPNQIHGRQWTPSTVLLPLVARNWR